MWRTTRERWDALWSLVYNDTQVESGLNVDNDDYGQAVEALIMHGWTDIPRLYPYRSGKWRDDAWLDWEDLETWRYLYRTMIRWYDDMMRRRDDEKLAEFNIGVCVKVQAHSSNCTLFQCLSSHAVFKLLTYTLFFFNSAASLYRSLGGQMLYDSSIRLSSQRPLWARCHRAILVYNKEKYIIEAPCHNNNTNPQCRNRSSKT